MAITYFIVFTVASFPCMILEIAGTVQTNILSDSNTTGNLVRADLRPTRTGTTQLDVLGGPFAKIIYWEGLLFDVPWGGRPIQLSVECVSDSEQWTRSLHREEKIECLAGGRRINAVVMVVTLSRWPCDSYIAKLYTRIMSFLWSIRYGTFSHLLPIEAKVQKLLASHSIKSLWVVPEFPILKKRYKRQGINIGVVSSEKKGNQNLHTRRNHIRRSVNSLLLPLLSDVNTK